MKNVATPVRHAAKHQRIVIPTPHSRGRNLAPLMGFYASYPELDSSLCSVESHVIPAKAGIQFFPDMDPRFRGGDVLSFTPMGGPLAHDHSE
jgi:hypothetical protein